MLMCRVRKFFALIRFFLLKYIFKKSGFVNFIYSNVRLKGLHKITFGVNNSIYENANLIVDSGINTQKINIENNNTIASFAILKTHGGYIKIGNNNFIGERTQIQGKGGVVIGDNTLIAPNCFISSSNHNFDNPNSSYYLMKEIPKTTSIGSHVWIGANCVILAGITIGEYAVVGAGSIVTKNVEPYTVITGNPAVVKKRFNHQLKKWLKS